jgi:hypothetical protein
MAPLGAGTSTLKQPVRQLGEQAEQQQQRPRQQQQQQQPQPQLRQAPPGGMLGDLAGDKEVPFADLKLGPSIGEGGFGKVSVCGVMRMVGWW